jgi:hypothetical protein
MPEPAGAEAEAEAAAGAGAAAGWASAMMGRVVRIERTAMRIRGVVIRDWS